MVPLERQVTHRNRQHIATKKNERNENKKSVHPGTEVRAGRTNRPCAWRRCSYTPKPRPKLLNHFKQCTMYNSHKLSLSLSLALYLSVSVYAYMHVCVCIYNRHTYRHIYTHAHISTNMYLCIYIYIYAHVCIRLMYAGELSCCSVLHSVS